MAYAFATKFDVSELDELERKLSRCSAEAAKAVSKSNRLYAKKLRDIERENAMPGQTYGQGPRHDTPAGTIKRGIRSRAGADWAEVRGSAPHVMVTEFGGGVFWTRMGGSMRRAYGHRSYTELATIAAEHHPGRGHGIFIKKRKPEGYTFFPVAREEVPGIQHDAVEAAMDAVHDTLT